jgi:hypothetical protein
VEAFVKNILSVPFVVGLVAIAAVVGIVLFMNRGAHLDLPGKIVKVRTVPVDDDHSVAVADFQVTNTSDYPFVVRTVTLVMEDPGGAQHEGLTSSDIDAQRFIEGTPILGQKFNPTLITQESVPGHGTKDRMVLATFGMPDAKLQARKRFIVRVEEIDGKIFEISEK